MTSPHISKRIPALFLCASVLVNACGGGNDTAATPSPAPTPAPAPTPTPPPPGSPPGPTPSPVPAPSPSPTPPPPADTQAPTIPAALTASTISAFSVALNWQGSSDNVGVAMYRIFRNGTQIGTSVTPAYQDSGLAASTTYTYAVAAVDAAGNVSVQSTAIQATTSAATGRVIQANPSNYLGLLDTLQPGDTMVLAPGDYLQDPPGLPVFNLNGTPAAPITITGPDTGPRPVLLGTNTHNTIRFSGSSYVIVRNIDVNGRHMVGDGVNAQGTSHHITLEGLHIYDVDDNQQIVGISTNGATTWNWIIRRCIIERAGTGMYLGSSTGGQPFIAGTIENNVIRDTIGYNIEVKHQNPRAAVPGMPTGKNSTVVRNNVFTKAGNSSGGADARPNLLVGHWPLSGPGVDDVYEIYGNFFYQNPTEALFQGEGNVAFHDNLLVTSGDAVNIQQHNDAPRTIRIFNNTIVASGRGIGVSGGASGFTQTVIGNAVFAATPISVSGAGASAVNNVTGSAANAANFLNNPFAPLGQLDLFPKTGQLSGAALDPTPWLSFIAADRDFNGNMKNWTMRGAYTGSGANPGWLPKLEIKP